MNKITILAIIALVLAGCGNKKSGDSASMLKTEMDSVSYAYGQYMAMQIKRSEWEKMNPDLIAQAFMDFQEKGDSGMVFDMMAASQLLMNYDSKAQSKVNVQAGQDYLAKNKSNEGVVQLPSGLQYKILNEGTGEKPGLTDTAVCNYTGHLISGKVFDASEEGEPAKFRVDQVIKGWTEALQLMGKGAKWMLYIPAELAYGSDGNEVIPPGSALVFEVELVDIKK